MITKSVQEPQHVATGDSLRAALDGVRVVDFSQIGAGPTCTMLLADMGADVIKVEPKGGDLGRRLGPPWYGDQSPIFIAFNRGKRSICLDLKTKGGREIAIELTRNADVVVESFRPGVLDQFSLGYRDVRLTNPAVVYCSVSGYGQSGPYTHHPGVDGILQAASGLMSLIGSEGSEPCKVQAPIVDVTTGYLAALGVLAQLIERRRTGFGRHLDISLFAGAVALQQSAITSYLGNSELPRQIGSSAPYSAPNEAFRTSDGWIMVAAYIGDRWRKLCILLGVPELELDDRFATSASRVENRAEMRRLLTPLFEQETCDTWIRRLEGEDILCSKVSTYEDLLQHPQLKYLGLIADMQHPTLGSVKAPGFPINSRAHGVEGYDPPPFPTGAHSREILTDLGLSEAEIERLISSSAVA